MVLSLYDVSFWGYHFEDIFLSYLFYSPSKMFFFCLEDIALFWLYETVHVSRTHYCSILEILPRETDGGWCMKCVHVRVMCEERNGSPHNTRRAREEHMAKCGRHFGNGAGAA